MSEDLLNEIEAINSIYGEDSLQTTTESEIYILNLPQHDTSLRLQFPPTYPATPPTVLGSQSSGSHARKKGEAAHIVELFREVLGRLYQPGEVCLFDVIEEVNAVLPRDTTSPPSGEAADPAAAAPPPPIPSRSKSQEEKSSSGADLSLDNYAEEQPPWTLSDVVVESKSIFVARAAPVSTPAQAKQYLQHLLDNDKKVRSATHNITAWRIKESQNNNSSNNTNTNSGVVFQDCDDDGETAAGGRVLHLMQLMDLWDVMIVVTRWYGGQQLGPKRFSIINSVARDAFVKAGLVRAEEPAGKKKGKKAGV